MRYIARVEARTVGTLVLAACIVTGCGGGQPAGQAPDAELDPALRAASEAFAGGAAEDLAGDSAAMEVAGRLYAARCSGCHGADGTGSRGITDLVSGHLNYGSTADAIRATIRDGRSSVMPGVGGEYGEVELGQIVDYVRSFASSEPLSDPARRGEVFYTESCVKCHGTDGAGNPEIGAPPLGDDYWQHGSSMMNIRLVITRGAESVCPAQSGQLTGTEIELLTAFVERLRST